MGLLLLAATTCSVPADSPPTAPQTTVMTNADVSTEVPTTSLPPGEWFLVWTTARLPDGFKSLLEGTPGITEVSVVWAGNARVIETRDEDGIPVDTAPRGFWIPVEIQRIDPEGHRGFAPEEVADALGSLQRDEVLLSESSARLRELGPGGTLRLWEGQELEVAGVVNDTWVGAAEMVTTRPSAVQLGAELPRYAIVRYQGEVSDLEARLARSETATRVRSVEEAPVFRHADAVRSQVDIKLRFGEFSLSPLEGRQVEVDPAWVEANIVTREIPLLGVVTCHRDFAGLLEEVMTFLDVSGHSDVIDPEAFLGCWNPRFITGRRDVSRHAWGIAADINFGNSADGPASPTDEALLAAMEAAGITSGHEWLDPDPGHFEWYGNEQPPG